MARFIASKPAHRPSAKTPVHNRKARGMAPLIIKQETHQEHRTKRLMHGVFKKPSIGK
jgi:hypothetical protein